MQELNTSFNFFYLNMVRKFSNPKKYKGKILTLDVAVKVY